MKSPEALWLLLKPWIDEGWFSQVYWGEWTLGKAFQGGYWDPLGPKIFDLASLTKPLVVLPLAAQSFENLQEKSLKNLPGGSLLNFSPWGSVSLGDSLAHRAGFPFWRCFWLRQEIRPWDLKVFLEHLGKDIFPNQGTVYSDLGYMLLGYLLGEGDLNGAWEELCRGAGWRGLLGYPSFLPVSKEAFVETAYCPVRERVLKGEIHDENAFFMACPLGHAGWFGSGESVLEFSALMAQTAWGKRIQNWCQNLPSSALWSYGLRRYKMPGGDVWGHDGFTGGSLWWKEDFKGGFVFLTNRVRKQRQAPREFFELRRQVAGWWQGVGMSLL